MIKIEPLTEIHLPFLNRLRNECRNNLHDNTEYSLEQTIEWFHKTNPQFYIIHERHLLLGYIRTSIVNDELYIGVDISEDQRNKGLATKVYNQFLYELFTKQNKEKVYLEVLDFNLSAIHLYKKFGFKEIETKEHIRNGEKFQSIKMELTREQWFRGSINIRFLIVIAYYNRPEIVRNALESIVNLQYDNFDIAFIDDGSNVNGKPIVESIFPEYLLARTTFYRCDDTKEQKIKQGGSRFGYYINEAIKSSTAEYFMLLCDDDAILPDYLKNLNEYLSKNKSPYCYCKVKFYDPSVETYREYRDTAERNFPGSQYNINHGHPLNPYGVIDSCQMVCNTACFKQDLIAYPFPQTRNLDAYVYARLFNLYGNCVPCGFFGQVKGAYAGQLGNIRTEF